MRTCREHFTPVERLKPATAEAIDSSTDSLEVSSVASLTKLSSAICRLQSISAALTTADQAGILLSMTNGSLAEAEHFLLTGRRRERCQPGSSTCPSTCSPAEVPLWTPEYDVQLGSRDKTVLRQLINQFGEDEVIRRVAYLSE